jgi:hypothetical protein
MSVDVSEEDFTSIFRIEYITCFHVGILLGSFDLESWKMFFRGICTFNGSFDLERWKMFFCGICTLNPLHSFVVPKLQLLKATSVKVKLLV